MMKKFFIAVLAVLLVHCSNGLEPEPLTVDPTIDAASLVIGDLSPISSGQVVKHTYYSLSYSEENEQANWVFYRLTPNFLNSAIERTDDFRADPAVSTGSATLNDYKGSGYDRGHLCPAADMKLNDVSISESFFLSNMSPQDASFNRGIWSSLESLVRTWCVAEDTIYVATGPFFKDNIGSIGTNRVTVPGYYYKAILDMTGDKKMIALVLPNAKSSSPIESYIISVDSLEILTGIDFFPGLPDQIEDLLEKESDKTKWGWVSTASNKLERSADVPSKSISTSQSSSGQCKGLAKSTGQRCKNKTMNTNGYCHVHQSQAK
jgi:endonuclease G, mitochondrial